MLKHIVYYTDPATGIRERFVQIGSSKEDIKDFILACCPDATGILICEF